LEGEAARAIEGLPVTEANYPPAIDIIKQRYGNKQQLVRGLDDLGVDSEKYGSLLILIIMARFLREIALVLISARSSQSNVKRNLEH